MVSSTALLALPILILCVGGVKVEVDCGVFGQRHFGVVVRRGARLIWDLACVIGIIYRLWAGTI
jgi:hypothetical protein